MSFDSSRSANSGPKSKRSFNSVSSNNSGGDDGIDNNNICKKKKTTTTKKSSQKTLGVPWGSNSRSSSRSSFLSSPFTDFGSYMVVKNRKLHDQFEAEASTSHSGSGTGKPVFHGVSIFVDGYTVPSNQELRGYMLKHGGRFENYFSRHHVTHIICSNLPDSKIKNLRSFSGGLPVVKPTWVLDSVAANKLLSWIPYQLDQLASETSNQPKLSAFFALKSNPVSDDAEDCITRQITSRAEDTSTKGSMAADAYFSVVGDSREDLNQHNGERDTLVHESSTGNFFEEPTCSDRNNHDEKIAEPTEVATVDKSVVGVESQCSPCRPSSSVTSYCSDVQNTKEESSTTIGLSCHRHSTLVDPNFVETYFKNSRLHFIGTWRNRYRKRFPSSSDGFRSLSNGSSSSQKNSIIHVDMDCFFVSVVIRNHPELWDKPVAICHSDNPRGTAEISSANYPARGHGVRAGIFVRDAKALCPHLVILPYNFEAYEEAMSCDEAFLDVIDSEVQDPQLLASVIRKEISDTTGCTASVGISGNMLMARLATRTAKPDGQCYLPPEKVEDYLKELPIKALPGIGHALEEKLKRRQVKTCGQLRMISKESLQKDFGLKTGDMLWNYCRGIDNRLVGMIQESKSVGAEVNWGVRFKDLKDSQIFLVNLCKEVSLRLQGCGVRGRTFTLKVKKRKPDADEPIKYMGCGDCENLSHSMTVPLATDDADVLQRITTQLFGYFHIEIKDIRGMGLQVSKLESADNEKQGHERNSIRSWLVSASARSGEQSKVSNPSTESAYKETEEEIAGNRNQLGRDSTAAANCNLVEVGSNLTVAANLFNCEASMNPGSALPPLSDLDMGVIKSLPPEIFSEMNDMYGGKLKSFMLEHKYRSVDMGSLCMLHGKFEGVRNEGVRPLLDLAASNGNVINDEAAEASHGETSGEYSMLNWTIGKTEQERQCKTAELQQLPVSREGTSDEVTSATFPENIGLMPSSLSQVDVSVLQQLPKELRVDILEILPAHRRPECASDASLVPLKSCNNSGSQPESRAIVSSNELWVGNPPGWVEKFEVSNCQILKDFAQMYHELGSTGNFSSILMRAIAGTQLCLVGDTAGLDDAISGLCELLRQYIELKIELDIEEIFTCFRILRRLCAKSDFFCQVYSIILPHLQASVSENYGGSFHI